MDPLDELIASPGEQGDALDELIATPPTPSRYSSHDAGVGSTRQPGKMGVLDKLLYSPMGQAIEKRSKLMEGKTGLLPQNALMQAYRGITGREVPLNEYIPEPTVAGFLKGLSNIPIGGARLQGEAMKKAASYLPEGDGVVGAITSGLKDYAGQQAGTAQWLAQKAEDLYNRSGGRSVTGEMVGEAVPTLLAPQTGLMKIPGALGKLARITGGATEGAISSMVSSPQAGAESGEDYWEAQRDTALMGGALGAGGATAGEFINPILKLLGKGKGQLPDVRKLAPELQGKAGDIPEDTLRESLRRQYANTSREAAEPFEALRAQDVPVKPTPDVTLHGGRSTYQGKRMGSLLGPEDEMIIAKSPDGKDVGFLWLTKEPDGFSIRKIEVDPKFQRKGIATYLNDEAEKAFGPYKGATDYTEQGKAFRTALDKRGGGEINLDIFKAKGKELIEELRNMGRKESDPIISIISEFTDRVDRAKQTGWARALDISADLRSAIKKGYESRMLKRLMGGLEENLGSFPEYKAAKTQWAEKMGPWRNKEEGRSILNRIYESPTPDKELLALAIKSPNEARIVFDHLDDSGKSAVKSSFLTRLNDEADKSTRGMVDFFKKNRKTAEVYFSPDELKQVEGMVKLRKVARRAGIATGVATGATVAAGAGLAHPLIGAYVGKKVGAEPLTRGFNSLLSTKEGQRLLLDASRLPENSPELAKLAEKLPFLLGLQAPSKEDKLKALLGKGQ